ncbi:hypothetical protein ACIQZG_22140 [Lysinibacillus sp. NPDC096418]|uniref:hypothetical protein n=1 Tax=Lysinibacillus sp. NPDC096418 TaxID=3364138 RepID=UPI0037FA9BE6
MELEERKIGFIQGVAYAAALMKEYSMNSESLIDESGISGDVLLKYADDHDLQILGLIETE